MDYCVKKKSRVRDLCKKLLSFHKEMISASFLWGNVILRGELQIDAINSNFQNFESALYMKSVSMPLSFNSKIIITINFTFFSFLKTSGSWSFSDKQNGGYCMTAQHTGMFTIWLFFLIRIRPGNYSTVHVRLSNGCWAHLLSSTNL